MGIALLATATTTLPFAVGAVKNGLIEILLLVPVGWFLVASRAREHASRALLLLVSLCLAVTVCDVILRPPVRPTRDRCYLAHEGGSVSLALPAAWRGGSVRTIRIRRSSDRSL